MTMEVNKLCFLCFQKCQSSGDIEEKEEPQFKTISLQSVLHYLTIGEEDEEGAGCGGGGDQVVVCDECHHVAFKLSLLLVKLEEIQLSIDYFLQQFSEKLNGRGDKGRKYSWNEQALKMYRRHIYQKCRSKLSCKRRPLVPIEKLVILEPVSLPVPQPELKEEEDTPPPTLDPGPPPVSPPPQLEDPLADDTDNLMEEEEQDAPLFEMEFSEEPVTSMAALIMKPPPSSVNDVFEDEPFHQVELEEAVEVNKELDEILRESPPVLTKERPLKPKKRKRGRPRIHPPKLSRTSGGSTSSSATIEPCPTCGIEFSSKWERQSHLYTHRLPRTLNLKNSNSNRVKCPHCVATWIRGGDQQLDLHNYVFHLDLLFVSSKLEGVPLSHFNDYCKHLLNSEGVLSKIKGGKGSSYKGYACQYCAKPLKSYASLRAHLIQKHKDILCGKLEEIQRDIPVDKLKEVMCPPVRDDNKCGECGASFSNYGSLNRHLKESCVYRKDKSVKYSKPCRCQDCGMRFRITVTFYRHRRKVHPDSIRPPIILKK